MAYRVEISPAAGRELRRLPSEALARLRPILIALGDDPRPHGTRKLTGTAHSYRVRVGSYHVVYDVDDAERLVLVLRIAWRSETTYS